MKTAVLFSLAFLVLAIAFLTPASGCDCQIFMSKTTIKDLNAKLELHGIAQVPPSITTPAEVCSGAPPAIKQHIASITNCP